MSQKVNIVLRLTNQKGGKWRVGIRTSATTQRTQYTLSGSSTIKRLPDGLFAAGRVIEDSMLPRLAELAGPQNAAGQSPAKSCPAPAGSEGGQRA